MKIFKKCVAVALALVMAQGVAVTSFAAETYAVESAATIDIAGSSAVTRTATIDLCVGQGKDVNGVLFVSGRASYSSKTPDILSVSKGGKMRGLKVGKGTAVVNMLDTGEVYECYVNVKPAPTSVTLNKTAVTNGVGQSFTLTASVAPSNTINNVTWSTSDRTVATVSTSGVVKCVKEGTATITAKTYNGKTATCTVTVKPAPTSLKLNTTSLPTGVSASYTLKGTVSLSNAYNVLTFKSSNTNVATVSSKGVIRGRTAGTATITVTTCNGISASCKVTVKNAPTAIALNKTSLSLEKGKSYTLTRTLTPSNAFSSETWTSSNTSVATVSSKGTVTAKGVGTATVTVKTYNGKTASCKVTVKEVDETAAIANQVVKLVNEERKKNGLSALTTTTSLTKAAQKRAVETSQSFSHTRPDGTSCFTIFSEYGISNRGGGENIACGYANPQSVMDGWMNSSGHKANILNSSFKSIGVGYYVKDGRKYWVQLFIA